MDVVKWGIVVMDFGLKNFDDSALAVCYQHSGITCINLSLPTSTNTKILLPSFKQHQSIIVVQLFTTSPDNPSISRPPDPHTSCQTWLSADTDTECDDASGLQPSNLSAKTQGQSRFPPMRATEKTNFPAVPTVLQSNVSSPGYRSADRNH